MTVCKSYVGYYIPMSVIVALKFDERFGTARFLKVKHKASSNAFPIYRPSSRRLNLWAFPTGFPSLARKSTSDA